MLTFGTVAVALFPLAMIMAGAMDVMTRRIPNLLIISIACAFFPSALAMGMPLWMVMENCATAIVLLGLGFIVFFFGFVGGGDAKLLAVAGLWLGFPPSVVFIGFSAVAGGLLAAAIALWFMLHVEASTRSQRLGAIFGELAPDVPYGFALAAGAILATPFSWLSLPFAGG